MKTKKYNKKYLKVLNQRCKNQAKKTIKWFEEGWGKESGDYDTSMLQCGRRDAKDLRQIGQLILQERFVTAYNKAWDMDTAARDTIPITVYNFIVRQVEK